MLLCIKASPSTTRKKRPSQEACASAPQLPFLQRHGGPRSAPRMIQPRAAHSAWGPCCLHSLGLEDCPPHILHLEAPPCSFSPGLPGSPASLHREIQAAFFLTTAAGCSSAQISRFLALVCLLYWGASSPEPQSSPWVGWRRGNLRVQRMIFNRLGDRVKRGCCKRNPYFPHSASYIKQLYLYRPHYFYRQKNETKPTINSQAEGAFTTWGVFR